MDQLELIVKGVGQLTGKRQDENEGERLKFSVREAEKDLIRFEEKELELLMLIEEREVSSSTGNSSSLILKRIIMS